ncbi:MAG TPA: carbamoyl phosphate synthase small subunit [Desulfotomaculum sp.]|nr:carbamoyl phosphate synthase small subunit [Desulfotomaculum sp.]
MKALIALEDGTIFEGESFTGSGEISGEIVFNTSMTGYQEILTDPSYKGQIVTMTYPLIGNYGINQEDMESRHVQVEGFIVHEYQPFYSNWRANMSLARFLKENKVLSVEGVDTRALTRHLRLEGAMKGVISTLDLDPARLVKKAINTPSLVGRDLVREVTWPKPYYWKDGPVGEPLPVTSRPSGRPLGFYSSDRLSACQPDGQVKPYRVVALDLGVKFNILRLLEKECTVLVLPAHTSATKILSLNPDGVFLSNGPGDPAGVGYVVETVRRLIDQKPIFGICLGHQILGLALGGKTFKLKFGHRGANQPVKNLLSGRVEITAQNHGFCVDFDSLDQEAVELTHLNLNDNTCEGIRHRQLPVFGVQYHPENSPGPHDASYLFDQFFELMKKHKIRG